MKTFDVSKWCELGVRLGEANKEKFEELLSALEQIVDAQETLREYDWQLFLRSRPSKRYHA